MAIKNNGRSTLHNIYYHHTTRSRETTSKVKANKCHRILLSRKIAFWKSVWVGLVIIIKSHPVLQIWLKSRRFFCFLLLLFLSRNILSLDLCVMCVYAAICHATKPKNSLMQCSNVSSLRMDCYYNNVCTLLLHATFNGQLHVYLFKYSLMYSNNAKLAVEKEKKRGFSPKMDTKFTHCDQKVIVGSFVSISVLVILFSYVTLRYERVSYYYCLTVV